MFNNRQILLGVTGSIAAYKSALLTRLLVKHGADVRVIMTPASEEFITPLTMATLSCRPVLRGFAGDDGAWHSHVDMGNNADMLLIAPATANTIAKMAAGMCDNLLLAVYLSARCPVFVAPAMDMDMYAHPSTKQNIATLIERGIYIIPPEKGELASGLVGEGRMSEPERIIAFIQKQYSKNLPLAGKKVMVTAGPTRENIDPVRFLGNRSSGKMGFALAEAAAKMGADVTLISGPTHLKKACNNIGRVDVITSEQMFEACMKHFPHTDICIMAAAVADYTVKNQAHNKIKKKDGKGLSLELTPTKDILATLGKQKSKGQMLIGFALETENEIENALGKLKNKNLDLIVLNSLRDEGACFDGDANKVTLIGADGTTEACTLKSKKEVAVDILNKIIATHVA